MSKVKKTVHEFKAVTKGGKVYWVQYDPEIYIPHSEIRQRIK